MPDSKFVAQLTNYFTNVVEAPKSEAKVLQLAKKYATKKAKLYAALKKKFGKPVPPQPLAGIEEGSWKYRSAYAWKKPLAYREAPGSWPGVKKTSCAKPNLTYSVVARFLEGGKATWILIKNGGWLPIFLTSGRMSKRSMEEVGSSAASSVHTPEDAAALAAALGGVAPGAHRSAHTHHRLSVANAGKHLLLHALSSSLTDESLPMSDTVSVSGNFKDGPPNDNRAKEKTEEEDATATGSSAQPRFSTDRGSTWTPYAASNVVLVLRYGCWTPPTDGADNAGGFQYVMCPSTPVGTSIKRSGRS
jgi:hypothetical protein